MLEQGTRISEREIRLNRVRTFLEMDVTCSWAVPGPNVLWNIHKVCAARGLIELFKLRRDGIVAEPIPLVAEQQIRAAWNLMQSVWSDFGDREGVAADAHALWGFR